ncbi:branched-chain amino acid aminotransferase [Acanthopleuribacter pedis]|uniref:branched-chain-amino-acid transaminase n=1 Tax=Acanthopleuribacter pedis TaxID=442870 RepID=A0A8J7Q237_9BACT|nr:branched-chain amino acid aminotransferase [Acanthopleuribacter pedis]MBO1319087.1 branched-chain amino acid aminotransferase [Acanthopleuribacter pedis]
MTTKQFVEEALTKPFGTVYADKMAVAHYRDGSWTPFEIQETKPFSMHPAAHVLHYGSTCFEGLKCHRWEDGSVHVFRLDRHIQRFQGSAERLCLPIPDAELVDSMVCELVTACKDWAPAFPGSLYVRPTLIGTLPSIGAAAGPSTEAMLFVILSPVGDYFSGGLRPLKLLVSEQLRTAPTLGMVKTGGNYAAALYATRQARAKYQTDQVLFAPDGFIQETGAANFLMISSEKIVTKSLDPSFLHGVTRDSLLQLGGKMGYEVEEREIAVSELLEWAKTGEAALSGTAAVLGGVGQLVYQEENYRVGTGEYGAETAKLRAALVDIHRGASEDTFGWLKKIV